MHAAFMEKVAVPEDGSACWLWTGPKHEKGYGLFNFRGLKVRAHRFAAAGFRMPETKLWACHRCDVPACVNPDHLFFARPIDNTLDMIQKGRRVPSHPTSETSRHTKLTIAEVAEIRREYANGVGLISLGLKYGVTKQNIFFIVKRKTWKGVA